MAADQAAASAVDATPLAAPGIDRAVARGVAHRAARIPRRLRRSTLASHGQALVELALILPVLLLLALAALDLGRLFYAQITLTNAAREGAMEAALNPTSFVAGAACDPTSNRIMCATVGEAANSFVALAPADVERACSPACAKAADTTVTVTVTGRFQLITPLIEVFIGDRNLHLSAEATADVVRLPAIAARTPASAAP